MEILALLSGLQSRTYFPRLINSCHQFCVMTGILPTAFRFQKCLKLNLGSILYAKIV
ncbi:hypothetical protein OHAE_598 [Ochrobactrum soli]|uniref:Uncharacterized protein n=1 Tax=Ochrobactrum soli TaxID=2448455 RepID=A0A2P9HKQ7_9HYPH|nr:hypothetical protein OHAE_598 [[Ochrobactrum] soli]